MPQAPAVDPPGAHQDPQRRIDQALDWGQEPQSGDRGVRQQQRHQRGRTRQPPGIGGGDRPADDRVHRYRGHP
ncbi:hypothetical protein GCM10028783_41600 [Modestobacter muralis]